ncbi:ABC transporter ATP-binding protein [Candidatus Poriferisodalis sp.]|uniref:ABC transporter ATP-binding protein n=1 Tax=Candidatus Poriferisodalis sp. TaxID=3101277 RepID=UPI003AF6E7C8
MSSRGAPAAEPVLQVEDLAVEFFTEHGWLSVVDGVSFEVGRGETVGLIGESGCGKSVTALAVIGLIPRRTGRISRGRIRLDGRDLLSLDERDLREIRGRKVAMVFQEPMTSIDPAFTVGKQMVEVLRRHLPMSKTQARQRSIELLDRVGITDPHRRIDSFPHELSGGMRQRVLIAMALSCEPDLLIADEPTTALDVTVQAQVLDLLAGLQAEMGTAVLLVTHDLGVVSENCERVIVMYAGEVVETAGTGDLFGRPRHPYTAAMLGSLPGLHPDEPLDPIPGIVPPRHALPPGCWYEPRCEHAIEVCASGHPTLVDIEERSVRCLRADELRLPGVGA